MRRKGVTHEKASRVHLLLSGTQLISKIIEKKMREPFREGLFWGFIIGAFLVNVNQKIFNLGKGFPGVLREDFVSHVW